MEGSLTVDASGGRKSKDEGSGTKDEMERLSCLHPLIHYSIRAAASTPALGAISDLRFGTVIK
jgi:hypothetical protein